MQIGDARTIGVDRVDPRAATVDEEDVFALAEHARIDASTGAFISSEK